MIHDNNLFGRVSQVTVSKRADCHQLQKEREREGDPFARLIGSKQEKYK